jgi:hypothetical protein
MSQSGSFDSLLESLLARSIGPFDKLPCANNTRHELALFVRPQCYDHGLPRKVLVTTYLSRVRELKLSTPPVQSCDIQDREMGITPSLVSALHALSPARLPTITSHLSHLHEFKGLTLAPSFSNSREVIFDPSPLVLTTRDFTSRRLEPLFPFLPSP